MTDREIDTLTSLRGWCDREKATAIHDALVQHSVEQRRPLYGVEIGVFGGRSLFAAALGLRDSPHGGHVVGIDPYTHASAIEGVRDEGHVQWWLGQCDFPVVLRECLAARDAMQLADWCSLLIAPAHLVAPAFGEIDYLHLDGNHVAENAMREARTWLPKVRSGGIVVVDDCDWEDVQPSLEWIAAACTLRHRVERPSGDGSSACDYAILEVAG